jgi:SAM-dependent methyltransferase
MSDDIKQIVRDKYGEIARAGGLGCCGGDGVCGSLAGGSFAEGYEHLDGYVPEADLGLGCGLPTQDAAIRAGDTVLDLGSGAGNDVFIARALVGPRGSVIGVDMVPDMVAKAKANAAKLGAANVTFHLGDIEQLPLPDDHVDVVISNCVLNLVPDKARAFTEIFRVLKPGGHFSVSDIVLEGQLPEAMLAAAVMVVGCVAGALQQHEYLDTITAAGFVDVEVRKRRRIDLPEDLLRQAVPAAAVEAFRRSGAGVWSLSVFGRRPATSAAVSGTGSPDASPR